ncbi:microfibril-associated glycoprotein 4-like [Pollicipes pollicipes]|uniref:microfibril-associated glycoprotein 4-like n=1 Tax=Pollicipes pollicipes TaxID=41117 RepID=UPI0018859F20|nr:microfibril-associated glycoprotein 4-like [Pollicipes pollicipes]
MPVSWPPAPEAVYRRITLPSPCLCSHVCLAHPRCQAAAAQPLDTGEVDCSLAQLRQPQPTPAGNNDLIFFERAGPADPELFCWPKEDGGCGLPHDCATLRAAGFDTSGVYKISPDGADAHVRVYCEMHGDGTSWTVLQRRWNSSVVNFERGFKAYEAGFGEPMHSYWLGLRTIEALTMRRRQILRATIWSGGEHQHADYDDFSVSGPGYRMSIGKYSGNAGNGLSKQQHEMFQTCHFDKAFGCHNGGWWTAEDDGQTNLNGIRDAKAGEVHSHWVVGNKDIVLEGSVMKIRPFEGPVFF